GFSQLVDSKIPGRGGVNPGKKNGAFAPAWSVCLQGTLARFAVAAAMCLLQAFMGARGATAAVASDAQIAPQVFQRARSALGSFANLAVGYRLADTDIHERAPRMREGCNANSSHLIQMRMTVNRIGGFQQKNFRGR